MQEVTLACKYLFQIKSMYLFFLWSGLRDAKIINYRVVTSSTPDIGLRFPRLCPLNIRFLCFPSIMMWSLPFSPLQDSSGCLALQNILPVFLSIFFLSASFPPVSVYSADLLQCQFPTSSVPHRPFVENLPTLRLRPTNFFFLFPSLAPRPL